MINYRVPPLVPCRPRINHFYLNRDVSTAVRFFSLYPPNL